MTHRNRKKTSRTKVKNLYVDTRGYASYRNPITGEVTYLGKYTLAHDVIAREANEHFEPSNGLRAQIFGTGEKTISQVIDEYLEEVAPSKPWDTETQKNHVWALKRYQRDFGSRLITVTERRFIGDYLHNNFERPETYNKHRQRLVDLYVYGISRGYVTYNEAEATLKRSLSKKLPINRKVRKRMDIEVFQEIRKVAPHWLQVAMDLSLVTLQARSEIVNAKYTDMRNGHLYVIRDKTSADSDMAFIKIKVTPQVEEIIGQSRGDALASPYIIHYSPKSRRRSHLDAKPHWTYVTPGYLTKAFSVARDKAGVFDNMTNRERPGFHEIRSLGGRIYVALGYSKDYIRALMTHTDEKTTTIYLTNPGQLQDG